MGGSAGRRTSWRALAAAALALWLVPAALALAPLWLPPLCCAVAAVRFRRARSQLLLAARRSSGRANACGGDRDLEEEEDARLLHRYLHDQVELVLVGGGSAGRAAAEEDHPPAPADPLLDRSHGELV